MIDEIALTASLDELRQRLPIPFVMEYYGHHPEEQTGERLKYRNPFRDDDRASLDFFYNDKGVQRWGDFASQEQGSVIDLVMRFEGKDEIDTEVLGKVRNMYANFLHSDWKPPIPEGGGERKALDPELALAAWELGDRSLAKYEVVAELLESKRALSLDSLMDWNLAVDPVSGKLMIPYPRFEALKYRYVGGDKSGMPGSKNRLYYRGELDLTKPVILCEGESDAWAASGYAEDEYTVVSVPGVGSQPTKIGAELRGAEEVIIFFDGDKAGREGASKWETYLRDSDCHVRVVPTPEGKDICDMSRDEFWRCIGQSRPKVLNVSDLEERPLGYCIVRGSGEKISETFVSDWTLKVKTVISTDEGNGYEGDLYLSGNLAEKGVILAPHDLSGTANLSKWSRRHGGSWFGSPGSHNKLTNLLDSVSGSAFIVPGTSRPGLVGSTYTYPGGHIGNMEVRTLPDSNNPLSLPENYLFEPCSAIDARVIMEDLLRMYDPEYILPILSWYALAPLRSLYHQFPVLAVSGMAGSGKTTVMRYVQRKFAGVAFETNLTATTPYGVSMIIGSNNAYVLWMDEYRKGGDPAAMDRLNQHIRDAYTATPSVRGGMHQDNYSKLAAIKTDLPICISGESYADEQSHRDRLIKVFLRNDGKGKQPSNEDSLAMHYLNWLITPTQYGRSKVEEPPVVTPVEAKGLSDRQRYNVGAIITGHKLLAEYAFHIGVDIPDLDVKSLINDMREESHTDQVIEVLLEVFESQHNDDNDAIVVSEGKTVVHSASVIEVARKMNLTLPFITKRQLTEYLKRNHDGYPYTDGRNRRTWVIPQDIRESEDGNA